MKKIVLLILIVFILSQLIALEITQEETTWLEEHPVIRLGIGESWAPFILTRENGNHEGFDVDFINLVNEIIGAHIEIVPGKWHEIVKMAQNREIDGLVDSAVKESRREFFNFTESYITQYYALATTPDKINTIRSKEDLQNKKLALIKGNVWLDDLVATLGNVQTIKTDTEKEAYTLVLEGKADASFLTLGMYSEYRKMFFENIAIAHIFNDDQYKLELVYSIRNDWPELVAILNKALNGITENEMNALYKKWFGFTTDDFKSWTWTQLTDDETAWLKEHPVIRIAPDPEFPPIEWIDENNDYQGITADFMKLIASALDIEFEVVHCKSWDEVLSKARNREVDLLPAAAQTPSRAEYMLFSDPHLVFPGVIITTRRNQNLNTSTKLNNKKVGIVSGYVWQEFFKRDHPEVNIVETANIVEGLRKVSTEEIDAFIVTLPIALYYIEKEGIHNLVVAGETEYKTKLSIQTRKDWPLLNSIMTKVLKSIPPKKKKEIINEWIRLKPMSIFSYKIFWLIVISIVGAVFLIVIVIATWNASLKKQVKRKTKELEDDIVIRMKTEEELKLSRERLKIASSILRHDIINDLTVIKSAVDIYREEGDGTMIDEIEKRVEKSIETIHNQREQVKFIDSHSDLDEYDLKKVIQKVLGNYPNLLITIKGNCVTYADNAIYSVFDNIVNNTVRHGKTYKLDIEIIPNKEHCEIKFKDHGIGVPDEIKDKVFDEGFHYGENGHTGIGLYIVQTTVEEYGGEVSVEDNTPNGAVFIVRLKKAIDRNKGNKRK
jgi:ABC-type amino acid transport substrate-binding protein/two-component sensor histidine kinase